MPLLNLTADALDSLEPQRQSNAVLSLTVPGMNSKVLELAVQSFPLPKSAIGIIEAYHNNERRKYAGNPTFDDLSVVFSDYIDNDVAGECAAWYSKVYNAKNGKIGWKRQYAATGIATQYGPNGQYERSWQIKGVWPSNFDPGDHDKTAEDYVRITMTLTIDKAILGPRVPSADYSTN